MGWGLSQERQVTCVELWSHLHSFLKTSNFHFIIIIFQTLVDTIRAHHTEPVTFSYTEDDIIQYALSIGATLPTDAHFVFEGHPEFSVIPTFLVTKVKFYCWTNFWTCPVLVKFSIYFLFPLPGL